MSEKRNWILSNINVFFCFPVMLSILWPLRFTLWCLTFILAPLWWPQLPSCCFMAEYTFADSACILHFKIFICGLEDTCYTVLVMSLMCRIKLILTAALFDHWCREQMGIWHKLTQHTEETTAVYIHSVIMISHFQIYTQALI